MFHFLLPAVGGVWIYGMMFSHQSVDPAGLDYCDRTLYLFCLCLLSGFLVLLAVVTVGYCLTYLAACCRKADRAS